MFPYQNRGTPSVKECGEVLGKISSFFRMTYHLVYLLIDFYQSHLCLCTDDEIFCIQK